MHFARVAKGKDFLRTHAALNRDHQQSISFSINRFVLESYLIWIKLAQSA